MPPIIPPRREQAMQAFALGATGVRAMATQSQQNISTPTGQVAWASGILHQYPPAAGSPTNYTSGYGWEILENGSGSLPVIRGGVINWVSPAGTVEIPGLVLFDSDGLVRNTITISGWSSFDSNGNPAAGTAALVAGSVSISFPAISASPIDAVRVACQKPAGTPGGLFVSALTAGVGFTISSTSSADTSTIYWEVIPVQPT